MSQFAFVSAERANHAVATLCRVVGVGVSGFYAWLHARLVHGIRNRVITPIMGSCAPQFIDTRCYKSDFGNAWLATESPLVGDPEQGGANWQHPARRGRGTLP